MAERHTYVYIDRGGELIPAGELAYDATTGTARFRYGRRYAQRRDRVPVDPLTSSPSLRAERTSRAFRVFSAACRSQRNPQGRAAT